ncbi:MAG: hypothetical protein ACD_9C00073G0001 [uncultured bacterium]|nr:MAG: hypothetical protein ACD_9C00073G0001 [uncultured bacterium]
MSENSTKAGRMTKALIFLVVIFFVGGLGGVYIDQRVLPFIRTNKYLSDIEFLKRSAENVTVINKTEQITIKEDDSINEVASQASNAVVNIISLSSEKDATANKNQKVSDQSGTGVVVTSDGVIVTHRSAIIEKNATYQTLLFNGDNHEAKLIGVDQFSDLAFLKIEASNLTAISLGDSADFRPGKKVVAIGNSSGEYQNRYAAGLLSNIAKTHNLGGKTVSLSEKLEGVFENDFNNQKEYIGGPVIGYSGDLVGIVGVNVVDGQNVYFQIPSNVLRDTLQRALNGGLENRPYFGAYYVPITKEYSIAHGLKRDRGALIYSPSGKQGLAIISSSPAEKSGLKINDIVLSVNDKAINLDNPFSNLINQYKKGDIIDLTVYRDEQEVKLSVQL